MLRSEDASPVPVNSPSPSPSSTPPPKGFRSPKASGAQRLRATGGFRLPDGQGQVAHAEKALMSPPIITSLPGEGPKMSDRGPQCCLQAGAVCKLVRSAGECYLRGTVFNCEAENSVAACDAKLGLPAMQNSNYGYLTYAWVYVKLRTGEFRHPPAGAAY